MKNFVFIYTLCCPDSGLVRYVGKTSRPKERYRRHTECSSGEHSHRVNWIKKLISEGKKPVMNIIDEVPFCDWKWWEQHYIKLYKSLGARLTNSTSGGDGGLSLDVRKKLSEKQKGKQILSDEQQIKNYQALVEWKNNGGQPWNKGKKYKQLTMSREAIEARNKKSKGKHGGKPVLQFDLDGNLLQEWPSAYDAWQSTNIGFKSISSCCTGRYKTAGGFVWKFKSEEQILKCA